jgi:hypothetical protein
MSNSRRFALTAVFMGLALVANGGETDARTSRLLDLASSGGYLRDERWKMAEEISAVPDAQMAEAATALLASGRRTDAGQALHELCFVWAQRAPEPALAFADAIPEKTLRDTCRASAIRGWAEADWKAARAWLEKQPPGAARDQMMGELLPLVAVRDPHAALQMLQEEIVRGRDIQTSEVMKICAKRDPAAAVKAWENLPPGKAKNSARESLALNWAKGQPEDAWRWASGFPDDKDGQGTRRNVILGIAEAAPDRAALLALQAPEKDRKELLERIAWTWAKQDPDAAVRWAGGLPEDVRAGIFVAILNRSTLADPKSLLPSMTSLSAGKDRDLAVSLVIHRWSDEDFDGVKKWLVQQPQSPDFPLFLLSCMNRLAEQDPELLFTLFEKLPDREKKNMRIHLKITLDQLRPDLASRLAPEK